MTNREALEKIAYGWYGAHNCRLIALGQLAEQPGHGIPVTGETDNAKIFTPDNIARVRNNLRDLRFRMLESIVERAMVDE